MKVFRRYRGGQVAAVFSVGASCSMQCKGERKATSGLRELRLIWLSQ